MDNNLLKQQLENEAIEKQIKEKKLKSDEEAKKDYDYQLEIYSEKFEHDIEHYGDYEWIAPETRSAYIELGIDEDIVNNVLYNDYNYGWLNFIKEIQQENKFDIVKFINRNPILFVNNRSEIFRDNINYLYNCLKKSDEMIDLFEKWPFLLGESINERINDIIDKLSEENVVSRNVLNKIFNVNFEQNEYFECNIECLNVCDLLMNVDEYTVRPDDFDQKFHEHYKEIFKGIDLIEKRRHVLSVQLKQALEKGYITYDRIINPIELNKILHYGITKTSIDSNKKFLQDVLIDKNKFEYLYDDNIYKTLEQNALLINIKLNGISNKLFEKLINGAKSETLYKYCELIYEEKKANFKSAFFTYIYKYIYGNNITELNDIDYNQFLVDLNNKFNKEFSEEEISELLKHDAYSYEALPLKYQSQRKILMTAIKYGYPKYKIFNILKGNSNISSLLQNVKQNVLDVSIEFINNNYLGDYLENRVQIAENVKKDIFEAVEKGKNISEHLLLLNNFCRRNGELIIQQLNTKMFDDDMGEFDYESLLFEHYEKTNEAELDDINQKIQTMYNLNNLAHHEHDLYLVAKFLQNDRINLNLKSAKNIVNSSVRSIDRIVNENNIKYEQIIEFISTCGEEKLTVEDKEKMNEVKEYLPCLVNSSKTQQILFECKQKIIDSIISKHITLLSATQEEKIDFYHKNGYIFEINKQSHNGNNLVFNIFSSSFKDPVSLHIGNKYLDARIKEYIENMELSTPILSVPKLSGKKLEYGEIGNNEEYLVETIKPGFYEDIDLNKLINIRISNFQMLSKGKTLLQRQNSFKYIVECEQDETIRKK